jgi:hypothetical protein
MNSFTHRLQREVVATASDLLAVPVDDGLHFDL